MKLKVSNQKQSAFLRENAPILVIMLAVFILGLVVIGVWQYFERNKTSEVVAQFETKVDNLVMSVNKDGNNNQNVSVETMTYNNEDKYTSAKSNPFESPLKKIEPTKNKESDKDKVKEEKEKKERLADQIKVLGLLGGPGKRLAIIELKNDVQIVKPGDRIASVTIRNISKERILVEEYGKEITYTFGGGQD